MLECNITSVHNRFRASSHCSCVFLGCSSRFPCSYKLTSLTINSVPFPWSNFGNSYTRAPILPVSLPRIIGSAFIHPSLIHLKLGDVRSQHSLAPIYENEHIRQSLRTLSLQFLLETYVNDQDTIRHLTQISQLNNLNDLTLIDLQFYSSHHVLSHVPPMSNLTQLDINRLQLGSFTIIREIDRIWPNLKCMKNPFDPTTTMPEEYKSMALSESSSSATSYPFKHLNEILTHSPPYEQQHFTFLCSMRLPLTSISFRGWAPKSASWHVMNTGFMNLTDITFHTAKVFDPTIQLFEVEQWRRRIKKLTYINCSFMGSFLIENASKLTSLTHLTLDQSPFLVSPTEWSPDHIITHFSQQRNLPSLCMLKINQSKPRNFSIDFDEKRAANMAQIDGKKMVFERKILDCGIASPVPH